MADSMTVRAARWSFAAAGLYGLAATLPLYARTPEGDPLFVWAFAGAAAAMQLVYLLIARNPLRFRPVIPTGIASKLSFAAPVAWLYAEKRVGATTLAFGIIDMALAAMFLWWWARLRPRAG